MKAKKTNFVNYFKYLMIIPIVIILASIIIGIIFNLNYDYDFRKINNFTVKFNTTVTENQYDSLETKLESLIENKGFKDFRIERIGEGAQNGLFVRIPNDDGSYETKIEYLKDAIEDEFETTASKISDSIVITTSDVGYSLPKNVSKIIWYSVLTISLALLFVFIYTFFRYNKASAFAIVISILLEVAMLVSSMILFRIPFNYYFILPFVIMIFTTIINTTLINNHVKSTLAIESYNKTTNSDRVTEAVSKTIKPIIIYSTIVICATLAVMFFGGHSLIYLGLALITGVAVSLFVSILFNTSLWSFWYNREKDAVLRRRLKAEKELEEKKDSKSDEKIVV